MKLALFILLGAATFATVTEGCQLLTVSGFVYDDVNGNDKPDPLDDFHASAKVTLGDATVILEGTDRTTTTNSNGVYQFDNVCLDGKPSVKVEKHGYKVEKYERKEDLDGHPTLSINAEISEISIDVTMVETSLVQPLSAGANGDPHFRTWRGERYDFHGECDLELVSDPSFLGKGLQVAIRTRIVRNWSKIDVAAIRIGNDVLEVKGGADVQQYWMNYEYQGALTTIGGFDVSYHKPNSKGHLYTIDLTGGDKIEIRTLKDFVRVDFKNPSAHLYSNTVGLLGNFSTGKKLARDGSTIIQDPIQFGQEWQVPEDDNTLFHEVTGPQLPNAKCIMPQEISVKEKRRRRRLGAPSITEAMARHACEKAGAAYEDVDACIFDVMAVGDIDMAEAY